MGPIFSIGLPKTGTLSLAVWLRDAFGIPSLHIGGRDELLPVRFEEGHFYVDHFSIYRNYHELSKEYPQSRFLVTWRPKREWLMSRAIHVLWGLRFEPHMPWAQEARDNDPHALLEAWSAEYDRHYGALPQTAANVLWLELGKWELKRDDLEVFLQRACRGGPPHEYDGLDKLKEMLRAYVPSDK